jgi:hypothetical protein
MTLTPRLQKFTLLAHITFSVGWLGAVVPYLALAILGLTSHDGQMVRAACLLMAFIGWFVIVPFSLATLLSGLVQSFASRRGLFRHWWVLVKFVLTIFAVIVLLVHMRDVNRLSRLAKDATLSGVDLRPELIHAAGGLLVLFAAMALSVFKPWGMTAYGRRRASQADPAHPPSRAATPMREPVFAAGKPRWQRTVGIHLAHAAIILLLLAAMLHITGLHHH